ncbi:hypothetical protein Anas_07849 [Armadillidium nasatum]|uniref:Uncharacterized protein n=1 Tax=Armadillidium nasatum TaxID=96803 RepID=A0A5N5TFY4_9CRUS|nr:hypothetical protein Anas_07849 [Armadillidium nasatum]
MRIGKGSARDVLLATFVVSGFSFPSPDESQYKIPEVGTGQRSQYYVLHSDGTYKYGFDGGDGAFESVKSHVVGSRDGKFGYVDPEGNAIRLEYKAGEEGFVPQGAHIPTPSPEFTKAFEEASNRIPTSFSHTSDSEVWDSNTDASYGFEFSSDDHSRNEKSDADGTVTGTYSYVDENGRKRNFNYRAGKGIGFVIDGDGLVEDVSGTAQSYSGPARQPSISGGGFSSHVTSTKSQTPGDASYSFTYDAGDHSRSETSDPNLNINGRFSFVADDGKERRVNYVAGASTGFQAEGDHLPKVSDVPSARPQTISSVARQPSRASSGYSGHSSVRQRGGSNGLSFSQPKVKVSQRPSQSRPFEEANIASSFSPEGPYSFSYKTSTHSRTESGDEKNNVKGNFAFIAEDDGQNRQINYEAGSATGFIAEGAHIPVGPVVPGAPSGQPTGRIVPVQSIPFEDPLASTDSDASYNFDFESDTYSRTETSDKDGNIAGTYTVVDEDGTKRTYKFKAGEGIGFETEEVSRTQGPAPAKPTPYAGPLASDFPASHTAGSAATSFQSSHTSSSPGTSFQSTHSTSTGSHGGIQTSYLPPSPSSHQTQHTFKKTPPSITSHHSFQPVLHTPSQPGHRFHSVPSTPTHSQQSFDDFTLNTYNVSPNSEKFGYVLKFN